MLTSSPVPASPQLRTSTIAVCGGGIGGLATALALKRIGFEPVIFERQQPQQLREEGLFLTLAPNGCNALRALDLADKVTVAGLPTRGLAIFEAIVGQLYLAILVARLVGLQTAAHPLTPRHSTREQP